MQMLRHRKIKGIEKELKGGMRRSLALLMK
jgi:hypothetical protein